MLNYETLLSSYDDKLTLMQWLKKVEAALKDASAVSFNVNKRGNATITFSVVFEDGSELESNPIILQQGESVTNAAITNGHLILTLSNGDELDAGDLGGVSGFSIDASQHLIVTYQNGTTQDLGAIFTGNVNIAGNFTANSIIENMGSDYTFVAGGAVGDFTQENIYAGIVKNGNKLTLVFAFNLTKRNAGVTERYPGTFYVPRSVWDKLYPAVLGDTAVLTQQKINALDTIGGAGIDVVAITYKGSERQIGLNIQVNNMVVDTKYYIRLEQTYLLSDSLI